jgi:hypothetical protein
MCGIDEKRKPGKLRHHYSAISLVLSYFSLIVRDPEHAHVPYTVIRGRQVPECEEAEPVNMILRGWQAAVHKQLKNCQILTSMGCSWTHFCKLH